MESKVLGELLGNAVVGELEKIKLLPQAAAHTIGRVVLKAQVEMIDEAGQVKGATFTVALDGYATENPRLLFPTS